MAGSKFSGYAVNLAIVIILMSNSVHSTLTMIGVGDPKTGYAGVSSYAGKNGEAKIEGKYAATKMSKVDAKVDIKNSSNTGTTHTDEIPAPSPESQPNPSSPPLSETSPPTPQIQICIPGVNITAKMSVAEAVPILAAGGTYGPCTATNHPTPPATTAPTPAPATPAPLPQLPQPIFLQTLTKPRPRVRRPIRISSVDQDCSDDEYEEEESEDCDDDDSIKSLTKNSEDCDDDEPIEALTKNSEDCDDNDPIEILIQPRPMRQNLQPLVQTMTRALATPVSTISAVTTLKPAIMSPAYKSASLSPNPNSQSANSSNPSNSQIINAAKIKAESHHEYSDNAGQTSTVSKPISSLGGASGGGQVSANK